MSAQPGPWTWSEDGDGHSLRDANGELVAVNDENGRLMASVPELLEALRPFAEDPALIDEHERHLVPYRCHAGICPKEQCGRCSRAIAAFYAIEKAEGRAENRE